MGTNITKIAPYVYLAKRSNSETIYDLYLLVPVDSEKTVDLSKVQPVKVPGTRIYIPYPSFEPSAPTPPAKPNNPPPPEPASASPYKFKHWEIDSEGVYLDIHIQGDNNEDLTTVIKFADADTEQATSLNDRHTLAPYLFFKKEAEKEHLYSRPSCIVLFDENTEVLHEEWTFHPGGSEIVITAGDSSKLEIENFIIDRIVRHEASDVSYSFKGVVYSAMNNHIRRGISRAIWGASIGGSMMPTAVNYPTQEQDILQHQSNRELIKDADEQIKGLESSNLFDTDADKPTEK